MKMTKAYQGNIQVKFNQVKNPVKVSIRSSVDAAREFERMLGAEAHYKEAFMVSYLNQANEIIVLDVDTIGTINSTQIEIASIIRKAICIGAKAIIVSHNHPSGNKRPSEADRTMTKKLVQAAKYFEISVLDHVIIAAGNGHYSFADNGERSLNG